MCMFFFVFTGLFDILQPLALNVVFGINRAQVWVLRALDRWHAHSDGIVQGRAEHIHQAFPLYYIDLVVKASELYERILYKRCRVDNIMATFVLVALLHRCRIAQMHTYHMALFMYIYMVYSDYICLAAKHWTQLEVAYGKNRQTRRKNNWGYILKRFGSWSPAHEFPAT